MRVTAAVKEQTRQRITAAASTLFGRQGFGPTTTRQLAEAAGVATGTLFNYFPSKEALGMALVAEHADRARAERAASGPDDGATLAEALFALVVGELRHLEPLRPFVAEILDASLTPFAARRADPDGTDAAAAFRTGHLEIVHELLGRHGHLEAATALTTQLYWTLYLGLLAFWTRDESPHQEDTLALLDRSLDLFVRGLSGPRDAEDGNHATHDR
jgi:AcrR family transcriptional regulator